MEIKEADLQKLIIDSGLVNRTDLDALSKKANEKKQKLGDILLSEGKISEPDLRRIQAHALGIPYVNLAEQKIDIDILSLIPEPIARNYNIVAYKKSDIGLEVAMLDVDDLPVIDFIKKKSGLKILA